MSRKRILGNTRMKLIAGAIFVGMASMATAASATSTTLVGGGATLPALGYAGTSAHKQVTPISGSLFFAFTNLSGAGNPAVSYCQTGSGAGKNVLAGGVIGGTTFSVQNACEDTTNPLAGFGAAKVGVDRSDLTQPSFAAADSPMATTDFTNYTNNHSTGKPLQFPAVAGAIAIAFRQDALGSLALTDANLCGIYSGSISNWTQLPGGQTGPITVVYRSDGSGTTFSLMNHLAAVCGFPTTAGGPVLHVDQAFTTAVAPFLPSPLASRFVGVSGNQAVADTVAATPGAIGYVEYANSKSAGDTFATVNGVSPSAFGGTVVPVTVGYNNLIVTGTWAANGAATTQAISPAPTTQCLALVDPSSYAVQAAGQYPIIAVSYLLGNSNGNGTDAANIRKLLGAPYNTAIRTATGSAPIKRIGAANTGIAYLSNADMVQSKFDGCVVN